MQRQLNENPRRAQAERLYLFRQRRVLVIRQWLAQVLTIERRELCLQPDLTSVDVVLG